VSYDGRHVNADRIYFVDQKGIITNLPEQWRQNERLWRDFVRQQNIRVTNAQAAAEFAQLMVEIQSAPGKLWQLWYNTKYFTVFDRALLENLYGTHWKYIPSPRTKGWSVKAAYVGPQPAQYSSPPTHEIDLDDQQRFHDLHQRFFGEK